MAILQELHPDIDDGIDRKVLSQLRGRFLKVNAGRLQRAREGLSTRQQRVLGLLPLLFHVNHPLLPGYVSAATPAGLAGYRPDEDTLAEAQRLTRSFVYKPRRHAPQPIQGLFLMGSLGTVAQAERSDLDLWLCHDPGLSADALDELRRKSALLEAWAATQGAEVHVFLVDPLRFARGERGPRLSSDDCGTCQHFLLLDEFYRTAIWLGGRTPLWWLVPAYEETRYGACAEALLNKRFIRADEVLDLGHLAAIPPGEFVGAGLWQLFKGIESPYKSVLKLLLIEVYASEHPAVECLSLRFKRAVYGNRLDLDVLDPYLMVYRRLEEYLLAQGDHERLELVRRCLYLKVGKPLTQPPRHRRKSWQRRLLERLVEEWGWGRQELARLDGRKGWKVRQVEAERRALVNELTYGYRFLSRFARQQQADSLVDRRDLGVLGRRLYAAFERRAGKVEHINPGIAPDLGEEVLALARSAGSGSSRPLWSLYAGHPGLEGHTAGLPLRQASSPVELLAWSLRNGVLDGATRLALLPGDSGLSETELERLAEALRQALPSPLPVVDEEALLAPGKPREVTLLVNVGVDPLPAYTQANLHLTSARIDALGYSGVRENLVLTLDQVTLNSWNELLVNRFDGPQALLDCLVALIGGLAPGERPRLRVHCFCRNRAEAIARRVEELFHDVLDSFARAPGGRYLLQVKQGFHLLELAPGQVSHAALPDIAALVGRLGQPQAFHRPLRLDRLALEGEDLGAILALGRPDRVQVFYRRIAGGVELSVLDERNSLWRQRLPFHDEASLLAPLERFLRAVLQRQAAQRAQDMADVDYHEVVPAAPGRPRGVERRPVPPGGLARPFHDVQAIIDPEGERRVVTLYCNHLAFSEREHGDGLFAVVAGHILGLRREEERYPCYITDLDLSAVLEPDRLQTLHYLRTKAQLERALNQALERDGGATASTPA